MDHVVNKGTGHDKPYILLLINTVNKSDLCDGAIDLGRYDHQIILGQFKEFSSPEFLGFDTESDMKKYLELPLTTQNLEKPKVGILDKIEKFLEKSSFCNECFSSEKI